MEKNRDEYTSFEGDSKYQEIIGLVFAVCFTIALSIFSVYNLITSAPVYSSVLGIVFISAVSFFILSNRPLKNIEVLEWHICRRLDKQGYPHEKKEGTLYIKKTTIVFVFILRMAVTIESNICTFYMNLPMTISRK